MEQPICLIKRLKNSSQASGRVATKLCLPIVYRGCRRGGLPYEDDRETTEEIFRAFRDTYRKQSQGHETSLGFQWRHARYHTSEHPRVQSMAIPDRYSDDVLPSIVDGDLSRLIQWATRMVVGHHSAAARQVCDHVLIGDDTATSAASRLPLPLSQIRLERNSILRELSARLEAFGWGRLLHPKRIN